MSSAARSTLPEGHHVSRVAAPAAEPERAALHAFGPVAEALGAGAPLDDLLWVVAAGFCRLLGAHRCSVHLREGDTERFRGRVAHPSGALVDAAVRRLVSGGEADRLTREILATRQPVMIGDTASDPRPVRAAMRAWHIRSILGVPLLQAGEVVGICYLDEDEPFAFTNAHRELASAFAGLAAVAVAQARLTERLRSRIETAVRRNDLLLRAATVEERLSKLVLAGTTPCEIAAVVTELTGKPCAIYHDSSGLIAAAPSAPEIVAPTLLDPSFRDLPEVRDALRRVAGTRASYVAPLPHAGLRHGFLLAPVALRGGPWGSLVVTEHGRRFAPLDPVVADRAALALALALSAAGREASAGGEAREALLRDLIRGTADEPSLARRGDYLGIQLALPHILCLVAGAGANLRDGLRTPRVEQALSEITGTSPRALAMLPDGVVALLDLPRDAPVATGVAQLRGRLAGIGRSLRPQAPFVASLSAVCHRPRDYPRAFEEARQVAVVADRFPASREHVLAADDLGPGRFLLSACSRDDARRFARDTLGGLADEPGGRAGALLLTLRTFFACSRSVRRTAERLGVHENTVRYRLARTEAVTGLAPAADAKDELTLQFALLVLELDGTLPAA